MTHHLEQFGKAMTAIAAVLAFSSTPLLAQETAPEPDVDTSVEPSVETPATADPLAPEPAATETAVPPAPQPKVESSPTRVERATPGASRSAARSTVRRANATASRAAVAAPPVTAAPPVPAAAPAPLPAEPPVASVPTVPPVAEAAPPSAAPEAQAPDLMSDDMLPIAGAAALGLLALGGAGIAARRRKRRREAEEFDARQQALATLEDEPVMELGARDEVRPGPAFARAAAPMHDPVPDNKAPAAGSDGFDASRFGRHVQAAYRGPTADNPSVSLEYRLRRAAALDENERVASAQPGAGRVAGAPERHPRISRWESRPDADFMIRRAGKTAKHPAED